MLRDPQNSVSNLVYVTRRPAAQRDAKELNIPPHL
jgi:hypothetical protein